MRCSKYSLRRAKWVDTAKIPEFVRKMFPKKKFENFKMDDNDDDVDDASYAHATQSLSAAGSSNNFLYSQFKYIFFEKCLF